MASRSKVQWAQFRVSVVTVVALLILSVLAYLLSGGTLFQQKALLYLYVPDATGIRAGSPVRVDGIGIGTVEDVELSGSNDPHRIVKLALTVDRRKLQSIPLDSFAQFSTENVIGDQYVDITSGTNPSPMRPGTEIPYKSQTEFMKSLDIGQLEQRLRQVDAILADIEQGRGLVGQFVLGDKMYNDLRRRLADLHIGIHEAVSTTSDVGRALYTDELFRKISAPLEELDRTLAEVQSGQGPAGQFVRDAAMYESARAAAADLSRSLSGLSSSEFFRSDQMYAEWSRSLASWIRSIDEFNLRPELATTQTYDNLNGLATELARGMRDFRENPKKFLRVKVF